MAGKGMIEPFGGNVSKVPGEISYGVSSYGYDMRLWDEFRVFRPEGLEVMDPKSAADGNFQPVKGDSCVIPAGSFALGRSLEYFRIPRDVLAICFGKSTYARCGVVVNVTPLEPEWEGYVTISISNTGPLPVRVYAGEGIAQVVFIASDGPCRTSYKDKSGKYQAQKGITLSKL